MKLVKIIWVDCEGKGGWCTREEARALKADGCETVGFLIEKDKVSYLVSSTWDMVNDNFYAPLRIPKKAVTRIEEI